MDFIVNNYLEILNAIALIVAGASIIVKFTPTPKDDSVVNAILKVLEKLALNKK